MSGYPRLSLDNGRVQFNCAHQISEKVLYILTLLYSLQDLKWITELQNVTYFMNHSFELLYQ